MKILTAEFVTSAGMSEQFPSDGRPQVAFAGRSNVGKSSLINALLNRRNLVKVSSTPGKTQTINFFIINNRFYFVDLPGYGYAKVPRAVAENWAPLIEEYIKNTAELKGVVVLIDSRRGPDYRDKRLGEWLGFHRIPAIYALTKADKLTQSEAKMALREAAAILGSDRPIVLTSAERRSGLKELWREIALRLDATDPKDACVHIPAMSLK